MSNAALTRLGTPGGFAPDPRFDAAHPAAPAPIEDPVAHAFAQGYEQGRAEAAAEAEAQARIDAAARGTIELSLARLDGELAEQLRQRLYATVEALCEGALAPLALNPDALTRRVERAAAMLARADDERMLRLHPDDLELVAERLPPGLSVEPDPTLERGALRIEGNAGGVEDGPDRWRQAIAEALGEC